MATFLRSILMMEQLLPDGQLLECYKVLLTLLNSLIKEGGRYPIIYRSNEQSQC